MARDRRERGASLVEFALVAPVLIVVLLGLIEGSLAMLARQSLAHEVAEASRRLTIERDDASADEVVLSGMFAATDAVPGLVVSQVVIYRPQVEGVDPVRRCQRGRAWSGSSPCNVYERGDALSFGCASGQDDAAWCPSDRQAGDLIGVWAEAEYRSVTGVFPSFTFRQQVTAFVEEDLR